MMVVIPCAIEFSQYVVGIGVMDVDDVILNWGGSIVGWCLVKGMIRIIGYRKTSLIYTFFAYIIGVPIFLILVFTLINNNF